MQAKGVVSEEWSFSVNPKYATFQTAEVTIPYAGDNNDVYLISWDPATSNLFVLFGNDITIDSKAKTVTATVESLGIIAVYSR